MLSEDASDKLCLFLADWWGRSGKALGVVFDCLHAKRHQGQVLFVHGGAYAAPPTTGEDLHGVWFILGLPGMCTIHANSAQDAVTKLCTLPLLAGQNISSGFVIPTVASCIDLVVHCARRADGHRHVAEILALGSRVENGVIETSTVFADDDGVLRPRSISLPKPEKFARAGIDLPSLLEAA